VGSAVQKPLHDPVAYGARRSRATRGGVDQEKQAARAVEEARRSALDQGCVCTQPLRKLNCSAPVARSKSGGCKCPYLRQLERSSSQNLRLGRSFFPPANLPRPGDQALGQYPYETRGGRLRAVAPHHPQCCPLATPWIRSRAWSLLPRCRRTLLQTPV